MTPVLAAFYTPFHANLENKTETLSRRELTDKPTDLKCPECGKPLLLRLGRNGQFYGCSGYPECKHTAPYKEDEKTALETAPTGKTCPKCGRELVVKRGRFGVFLGCAGYPECKHTERIEKKLGIACPKCGSGDIVERRSKKRGKVFYGCNRYPDCDFVLWNRPTGEKCPLDGGLLVYQKQNTVGCSNKECAFAPRTGETNA